MKNVGKMIPRTAIPIGNEEIAVVLSRFLAGEHLVGEQVETFENYLTAYLRVRRTFAFNFGRTALYAAIQALDLKPGEEVVVPAYTCAIVFEVILRLGLKPVLVDVNPQTYNIDPELISKVVTSKTRAVVPVHLFGRPCEMDQIMEIAEKKGLYIVEDAAQALGAEYKKVKVGTFGDLAIFSFGPGKSMTSGEGGAIVANNEDLIENIMDVQAKLTDSNLKWSFHLLKNVIGMRVFSNPYLYALVRGYLEEDLNKTDKKILENCVSLMYQKHNANLYPTIKLAKMPLFSARIARIQLKKLDELNRKRIMNAMALTKLLAGINDHVQLPKIDENVKNTFTRYAIKLLKGSRDDVIRGLMKRGVDTEKPYDYLIDLFKSFRVKAPNATAITESTLTIPNHPLLKASDVPRIANALWSQLNAD